MFFGTLQTGKVKGKDQVFPVHTVKACVGCLNIVVSLSTSVPDGTQ